MAGIAIVCYVRGAALGREGVVVASGGCFETMWGDWLQVQLQAVATCFIPGLGLLSGAEVQLGVCAQCNLTK
jgi:hypothetical protein